MCIFVVISSFSRVSNWSHKTGWLLTQMNHHLNSKGSNSIVMNMKICLLATNWSSTFGLGIAHVAFIVFSTQLRWKISLLWAVAFAMWAHLHLNIYQWRATLWGLHSWVFHKLLIWNKIQLTRLPSYGGGVLLRKKVRRPLFLSRIML